MSMNYLVPDFPVVIMIQGNWPSRSKIVHRTQACERQSFRRIEYTCSENGHEYYRSNYQHSCREKKIGKQSDSDESV